MTNILYKILIIILTLIIITIQNISIKTKTIIKKKNNKKIIFLKYAKNYQRISISAKDRTIIIKIKNKSNKKINQLEQIR